MIMLIKNQHMRTVFLAISAVLPWSIKRRLLALFFGYEIDPRAKIGISIVDSASLTMGKHAWVGHLTICKGLDRLVLEDYAAVGNLNWITGGAQRKLESWESGRTPNSSLKIGQHSAITHRHYLDCSDSFTIGAFSTFAGVRSQVFTHSIDLSNSRQTTRPVAIGSYCLVGTGSILLPGAVLPSYSVLGAGSVLRSGLDKEWSLYSGIPAAYVKEISSDAAYFCRKAGFVD